MLKYSFIFLSISLIPNLIYDFLAISYNHSQYETSIKAFLVENATNQIIKPERVGAVLFNFDTKNDTYIASEAPLNENIFLNIIWENKIDTFITLTNDNDNNFLKTLFFRNGTKVDLHFLYNIQGMQKDFFITKPKIIEGLYGIIVLQSEIIKNNEIRKITQILCNSWEDNTILDQDKLDFLINIINKYHINHKTPLFVNCFLGIGRTRFLISKLHIKLSDENFNKTSKEYFQKNYNKQTIERGEFLEFYKNN